MIKKKKKKAFQEASPVAEGNEKKSRRSLRKCVEDWDIDNKSLDDLINIIVSLVILCALVSAGLFTLTLNEHLLSIIIIPLVAYTSFSNRGIQLRMRERPSMLLIPDIVCVILIILTCLYMDSLFAAKDSNLYEVLAFGFVGIFGFVGFVGRWKWFYYLGGPFAGLYSAFFAHYYGLSMDEASFILFGLLLLFVSTVWSHPFYFGIGRVIYRDGSIARVTEAEQKVIEARLKAERKKEAEEKKEAAAKFK